MGRVSESSNFFHLLIWTSCAALGAFHFAEKTPLHEPFTHQYASHVTGVKGFELKLKKFLYEPLGHVFSDRGPANTQSLRKV